MRLPIAIATGWLAAVLAGCGDAKSVDYVEREAEDERREEVRSADVADAREERDKADAAYDRDKATADTASPQLR
jgi:hypothetical protein